MRSGSSGLTRRDLITGSVAGLAGYALAAGPAQASALHTPSEGLETGEIVIAGAGADFAAYYARPLRKRTPSLVLVVHEIFGLHEYIRDVCRRFAHAGFFALAPDLFARQGDPRAATSVDELLERIVSRVSDAQVMADLDVSLRWAEQRGANAWRSHVVGFCWGGRIAWLYAVHRPALVAAAAFYGRLSGSVRPETPRHPLDLVEEPMAPVLGLYGGADSAIPLEEVFAMRRGLAQASQRSEILIFPEAPHGFHADYRPSYREGEARQAWRQVLDWFARY